MTLNNPEITQQALSLVRSGDPFTWNIIALLALTAYVYSNEYSKKNYRGIAAGLSLYMVHWLCEIVNALIQHFSGHALWAVPGGSSFVFLIGVGVELSFMFSIVGIIGTNIAPKDPKAKILGINNRLFMTIINAAGFSIFEIFLVKTPTFAWVYPWWGALPVFITVYIPFFAAAFYVYDWEPPKQKRFIVSLLTINVISLILFAGILNWI